MPEYSENGRHLTHIEVVGRLLHPGHTAQSHMQHWVKERGPVRTGRPEAVQTNSGKRRAVWPSPDRSWLRVAGKQCYYFEPSACCLVSATWKAGYGCCCVCKVRVSAMKYSSEK